VKLVGFSRIQKIGLAVSLLFNVALITYCIYQKQEGVLWLEVQEAKPVITPLSHTEELKTVFQEFDQKSDQALISLLDDATCLSQGYRSSEIATSLLFDRNFQIIEPLSSLGAWPQPLSSFTFKKPDSTEKTVYLFSKLRQVDIQAIKTYILETLVPYTASGIIERLPTTHEREAFQKALFRTDEWALFQKAFQPLNIKEENLLSLAEELGKDLFCEVVTLSKSSSSFDSTKLLLSLFSKKPSERLAELIVSSRASLAVEADDETLIKLFSTLSPSEKGARLAIKVLKAQRKSDVWRASQGYLAKAFHQDDLLTMPRDQILGKVHTKFQFQEKRKQEKPLLASTQTNKAQEKPQTKPKSVQTVSSQVSQKIATRQLKPYKNYLTKKGDTLWSIAKKFQVDPVKLKYLNNIKGNTITPGKVLVIPH
jgi:LysM repeat protein